MTASLREPPNTTMARQDLPCTLDRSQENPLGVAFRKSFVIKLDLRGPKQRDQEANDRSMQSGSTSEPSDLGRQLGIIMCGEIARNHIGSGGLPFETYRQTLAGGWGGLKMPCFFRVLQLQRVEYRMS